METGYLFVHRSTLEASGEIRVSPSRLNGTNRVFHRDPTCSGAGRHGGDDIIVVSAAIRNGAAVLQTGTTPVKECRHCHDYRPPTDPNDEIWRAEALCQEDEAGIHFSTVESDIALAVEACSLCPSRKECLDYALETRQEFGVWGGSTPEERGVSADVIRIGTALLEDYSDLTLDLIFEEVQAS